MGCYGSKDKSKPSFTDPADRQQNTIKIEKATPHDPAQIQPQPILDPQDREIKLILTPVQTVITERRPQDILKEIVKLADQCIEHYNAHDIDTAYQIFVKVEKDIKQLQQRGFKVQMNQHFKHQFIQLSHLLTQEYSDMIEFNNQILKGGWKLQKDKKNFKIFSRVEGNTVGIKFQSILQVPFEYFVAIMIQPQHYHAFLPFIVKSQELKIVRRNCKLGTVEMGFPIISNREAYFQGILYNRLNNKKAQDRQFFMYTRSIHNRKDIQQQVGYEVKQNPKCVQFDYKYLVVKYVPLSDSSGRMIMGMNIDLKLNMVPLSILEMVSISFSQQFYESIVKISQKFEGSVWDEGIKKNSELFEFTRNAKNDFLKKSKR